MSATNLARSRAAFATAGVVVTAVGLVLVLLLVTSKSGHGQRSVAPLSRADYIRQSDVVCKSTGIQLASLKLSADPDMNAAAAGYLRGAVQGIRAEMARLSVLKKPSADVVLLDALQRKQLAIVRQLEAAAADYAAGRSTQAAAKLTPMAAGAQALQAGFKEYGFKVCGQLAR